MTRILGPVVASLLVLSACSGEKAPVSAPAQAPTNTARPAEPSAPKDTPAKPIEAPPADSAAKPAPADPTTKPAEAPPADTAKPAGKVNMDADIQTLMAKTEQPDERIEIQHVLISFKGAPRMPPSITRTKEEAKALAEKVYAEAVGGADFLTLVKQHTNDSAPGIYPMTKSGRTQMVKGFGDVGFRLKVGEIGVAPWDATASPYGWHIIKRLK
jgi:hypothetical protein